MCCVCIWWKWVCGCMYPWVHVWNPEQDALYLIPQRHGLSQNWKPAVPDKTSLSLASQWWGSGCASWLAFGVGAVVSNPGPSACTASALAHWAVSSPRAHFLHMSTLHFSHMLWDNKNTLLVIQVESLLVAFGWYARLHQSQVLGAQQPFLFITMCVELSWVWFGFFITSIFALAPKYRISLCHLVASIGTVASTVVQGVSVGIKSARMTWLFVFCLLFLVAM